MDVRWSLGVRDLKALSLYRDAELLANLPIDQRTYQDTNLDPNTRYVYRLVVERQHGSDEASESATSTLAYRPKISGQLATTWNGLQQPIIDDRNPDYTEYRVILVHTDDGHTTVSNWSTSKCRVFDDLKPNSSYRISVRARNLDLIQTKSANERAEEHGLDYFIPIVRTRIHPDTDDPWVRARIRNVTLIYGLTDAAEEWMNNNILIEWRRGEPGWAGYLFGYVGVGQSHPGTLMHEVMHAFWQFWDGFPEPCDQMHFYTFRRDVAQFALDFRDNDRSGSSNLLEPWHPYYNLIVGSLAIQPLGGEDSWDLFERDEYGKLWGELYHQLETSIPGYNPNHLSLVPPRLRKYLHGFMEQGESKTWEEEFDWYTRLADEDLGLWSPLLTHAVAHNSSVTRAPESALRTRIPEPLRMTLREADRRMLVDFINTLEDQVPWEWREGSPGFWELYVTSHLYRMSLYWKELDSSVGIELGQANLEAVVETLRVLRDLHCLPNQRHCGYDPNYRGMRTGDEVHEIITNSNLISDIQRRVLLEMIDMRFDCHIESTVCYDTPSGAGEA